MAWLSIARRNSISNGRKNNKKKKKENKRKHKIEAQFQFEKSRGSAGSRVALILSFKIRYLCSFIMFPKQK